MWWNTQNIQQKILFSCSGNMILKTIKIYKNFLYSELKVKKLLKVEYFVRIYQTSSATTQI